MINKTITLKAKVKNYSLTLVYVFINQCNPNQLNEVTMSNLNFSELEDLYELANLVHVISIVKLNSKLDEVARKLQSHSEALLNLSNEAYEMSFPLTVLQKAMLAINSSENSDSKWTMEDAQALVNEVIKYEQPLKAFEARNRIQEQENRKSLQNYILQLVSHYARILVIRIDLFYQFKSDIQSELTLENFTNDWKRFRELLSNKATVFENLHGFAWALEQGADKGYHCHLLLIYDGAKHQNDGGLGSLVGEKWTEVTGRRGAFFLCNTSDYKQEMINRGTLGIGMIHRNNEFEVKNLMQVAYYLVNPEKLYQHPVVKIGNMRTFGKGEFRVKWRRGIK